MGGHAAGEIASARATDVLKKHLQGNQRILQAFAKEPTPFHRNAALSLVEQAIQRACGEIYRLAHKDAAKRGMGTTLVCLVVAGYRDRKSTRLNSSHQIISYAVFCLKKKK